MSEGPNKKRMVDGPSRQLPYPSTSGTARPVPFQQPSSLLTFSYTPSRTLEFTDSALRYYAQPPDGAELRYGYERWVRRPEEKGRLDGLLKAVSRVRAKVDASGGNGAGWLRDVGVVSWRGVITKLLTAPYEERDGWEMNVMMEGGTLYLEEHLSEARLAEKNDMTPHHRTRTYYGYAFESWCTSSNPHSVETLDGHPRGWGGDVDTNVQWCSVVKTKLGDTRMVIGGEVDCVRGKFTGQTDTFVELKTSLVIRGPQDESKFEKKLLKFYFQSFLLGVPEILVGFRTPSGRLTTVQSFKTIQLPRLVRGKPHAWDPLVCLDWGHRFLAYLKSVVGTDVQKTEDSHSRAREGAPQSIERKVWRVKFTPRVGVSVALLDSAGVDEVEAAEDRVGFLPKWYWEELQTDGVDRPAEHHATAAGTESTAVHGWKV
ncbi:RAI1-domain-containing protein [Amylocystis lapponica]|nr:RAI1-domain-containing protein [Amylocystis lapponica]